MPHDSRKAAPAADTARTPGAGDPVLADLEQAEKDYQAWRAEWERDRAEVAEARAVREDLEKEIKRLEARLGTAKKRGAQQRKQIARHKARAEQLAAHLKEIHRALFAGNLYDLILKACLAITG